MIYILSALKIEAHSFKSKNPTTFKCIVSGMGEENARLAAEQAIEQGGKALISWGCAAGLAPHLKAGDVIIPKHIQHATGETFATEPTWHQHLISQLPATLNFYDDTLLHSSNIISSKQQKTQLYAQHQCIATDMESFAIARVAQQAKLPFLCIRAICDTSHDNLPSSIANTNSFKHKLLAKLLLNPLNWPKLAQLAGNFRAATRNLKITARSLCFQNFGK